MSKCKCNYCNGKGYVNNTYKTSFKRCPVCNGTKEIEETECKNTISVEESIDSFLAEFE